MSLFYKDGLHLIKNGNELLAKEILCSYKSLKIKLHNSSIRSFKDVTSFSINDSEFPPLLSGYSTSNHPMLKKQSDQKAVYYQQLSQHVFIQICMCLPLELTCYQRQ